MPVYEKQGEHGAPISHRLSFKLWCFIQYVLHKIFKNYACVSRVSGKIRLKAGMSLCVTSGNGLDIEVSDDVTRISASSGADVVIDDTLGFGAAKEDS